MEHKDNKNNLFLLTIVGIVAIVAIVILVMSSGSRTYDALDDSAGQASSAASTQLVTGSKSSTTRAPTPIITARCTDTDNGKNYGTKGTVSYTYGSRKDSKSDYCRQYNSAILSEQYCLNGKLASIDYKCPYGCYAGACKKPVNNLVTQTISLTTGWNYISLNVKPGSLMITDLMKELVEEDSLVMIKNNAGQIYYPVMDINQLIQINLNEGYLINVNKNTQLQIVGEKIPLPYTIPLNNGWNMMSYPSQNTVNAMDVLLELKSSGVLVKVQDESGNAIENLPGIGWVDNIKQFKPGEGYMINVNQEAKLAIKESYNTAYCGNGVVDTIEQCEIGQVQKCEAINPKLYVDGEATCKKDCTLDLSQCVSSFNDYVKVLQIKNRGTVSDPNVGGSLEYGDITKMYGYASQGKIFKVKANIVHFPNNAKYSFPFELAVNPTLPEFECAEYKMYPVGTSGTYTTWIECATKKYAITSSNYDAAEFTISIPAGNPYVGQVVIAGARLFKNGVYVVSDSLFVTYAEVYAKDKPVAYCGDEVIDGVEQCDGSNLKSLQCTDINGFTGGELSCYPAKSQNGCSWDTSKCVELHVNVEETTNGNVADVAQKDTLLITWTANSYMANYMRYIDAIHIPSDLRVRVESTNDIVGASGKYSWTIPSYLPDGEYVIEIGAQPQGYGPYSRSDVFKVN